MQRLWSLFTIAILGTTLVLSGCEGDAGPAGKNGEQGAAGDPGAKGTAGAAGAAGEKGDPGAAGKDVDPAVLADIQAKLDEASNVELESCGICHKDTPAVKHQNIYNKYTDATRFELTYDSAVVVANTGADAGTFNTTVKFKIMKDGLPYVDAAQLPSLPQHTFYASTYDSGTKKFNASASFSNNTTTPVAGQPGFYTVNNPKMPFDMTANGQFYGYIAAEQLDTESGGHVKMYADVASMGKAFGSAATTPYVSAANISGCEKCHGAPYMKHGYRDPKVAGLGDFASCKVCHYDTRNGGHLDWQILQNDPARYAELDGLAKAAAAAGDTTKDSIGENLTTEEKTTYAYTANVMNDVHMAHAMEFPYPQPMANCATCHEGKINMITDDSKFVKAVCISCHAMKGSETYGTADHALETIWAKAGTAILNMHTPTSAPLAECNSCHAAGQAAATKRFTDLHNGGYFNKVYSAGGAQRYPDVFKASVDTTTFDATTNKLTIEFSVTEEGGASTVAGVDAADVVPTLMVALYGYDSKDFIVSPHSRDSLPDVGTCSPACSSSQYCDASNKCVSNPRLLEFPIGTANSRLTVDTNTPPNWKVTVDLSTWAQMITDKKVKRIEIGVMPALTVPVGDKDEDVGTCSPACTSGNHCNASNACVPNDDVSVGLNAPSRTFDLGANAFADDYFTDIVDVTKCNACHEQLATTFHSGNRGGNIRVCRMCHVGLSGGSHLEMQSRSIDSYVHAIHSFQPFDPGDIDFTDPVTAIRYQHHIEHVFPNFTIKNCEACHNAGTYNVPDQAKSMPGLLSGSDTCRTSNPDLTGKCVVANRAIQNVPAQVTGPAARACGGCHKAHMINEDEFGELKAFFQHTKENGYLVTNAAGVLDKVIETIMSK